MDAEALMKLAIARCREGTASGQSPFGCAIAIDRTVVAAEHNTVRRLADPTAHAEMNTVRAACRSRHSAKLPGAVVAATCEPCPMCMTALHWAGVAEVYFGASIADAAAAGFHQVALPASDVAAAGGNRVRVVGGVLAEQCRQLLMDWQSSTHGHK